MCWWVVDLCQVFCVVTYCIHFFQAKHLQFVSGVDVTNYWLATFSWDLINSLVPVSLSVVLFAAFQIDGYSGQGLAAVFCLLVSYIKNVHKKYNFFPFCMCMQYLICWATLPIIYCFSFLFTKSLVAFGAAVAGLFFTSQVCHSSSLHAVSSMLYYTYGAWIIIETLL